MPDEKLPSVYYKLSKLLDGHLGRVLLDPVQFRAEYPSPVLLLEPFDESRPEAISTPPPDEDPALSLTTTDMVATPTGTVMDLTIVHPEARVAWLSKSHRNPFVGQITIGRARNNDLIFQHPSVSKVHAIVRETQGRYFVEDLGSTNGTSYDGVKLPPKRARELNDGASLRFGNGVIARYFEANSFMEFCKLLRK